MAYDSKKVAGYLAIGLLVATLIILAAQLLPVPFISLSETGVLTLKITERICALLTWIFYVHSSL